LAAEIIINEASLPFDFSEGGYDKLVDFFQIVHKANLEKIALSRVDGSYGSWNSFVYSDNFQLSEWMHNIDDKDISRIVKSVVSKVDCPQAALNDDQINHVENAMFCLSSEQDVEVQSLGVASHVKSHAISFQTCEKWLANPVKICRQWDESGEWKEQLIDVPNICTLAELDQFLASVLEEKQSNRFYLRELKTRNEEFPNIVLFNSALKNLKSHSVTAIDSTRVIDALNRLSQSVEKARNLEELCEISGLTISPESAETMSNRKYARQREFKNPEGEVVCCEVHVKNFLSGKRMHILVDYSSHVVNVGYFGNHLPTVAFPK